MSLRSALLLSILLLGCKRNIQNKEAVRQGVMNHLAKRSDLSSMDVRIDAVSFAKDEANAMVYIAPKAGGPGGMQMRYLLERKNNEWVVKGRPGSGAGSNPHGGANGMQMPMPLPPGNNSALPPGHPQVPAQSSRPQP